MLEAHVSKFWSSLENIEGVLVAFCEHPSFLTKHEEVIPLPKLTICERFSKLIANRSATSHKIVAASGIFEEYVELYQGNDVLIDQFDDKKVGEAKKEHDKRKNRPSI